MEERMRFVLAAGAEGAVMSELCSVFGISRETGYKWLRRYRSEGVEGLKDRPRAPLVHGRARSAELVTTVLAERERHPSWGPRKLRAKLMQRGLEVTPPAASTIGEWLKREALTQGRQRRRRGPPFGQPFLAADRPNAVWCIDFKGWFRTGDGVRCDPLTITDAMSRYLLVCQAVERPDHDHVREVMEAAFSAFGLPQAIRSDNGAPFASVGAGGLSALSLWWLKLGITPERITPGKPQQNGRHERMHRTLEQDTARPPARTIGEQQNRFDRFREEFNTERPHEALGYAVPAALYQRSSRAYPCPLKEPEYPESGAVRRVRTNGTIKWGGELIFISEVLTGEPVLVEETEAGDWRVRYADIELGFLDIKHRRLSRNPITAGSKQVDGVVGGAAAPPTTPHPEPVAA